MHELAIATSLIQIAKESTAGYNVKHILLIRVRYGTLVQLIPEALEVAFDTLKKEDTLLENACLVFEKVEALLQCSHCKNTFTPLEKEDIFSPCPHCHTITSHNVLKGRELFLDHIEAE